MLALCLMLLGTYYAQNYAGIIGRSLYETVMLLNTKTINSEMMKNVIPGFNDESNKKN